MDEPKAIGVNATPAVRTPSQVALLAILAALGEGATDRQIVAAAPGLGCRYSPSRLRSARSDLFRLGEVAQCPEPARVGGRRVARWVIPAGGKPAIELDDRARKHLARLWSRREAMEQGRAQPTGEARALHYEIAFLLDLVGRP